MAIICSGKNACCLNNHLANLLDFHQHHQLAFVRKLEVCPEFLQLPSRHTVCLILDFAIASHFTKLLLDHVRIVL